MSVTFKDNSAAVLAQMERNKAKALESIGLAWQRNATIEATEQGAVDTGRYRSSMTYETDEPNDRVIVGTRSHASICANIPIICHARA